MRKGEDRMNLEEMMKADGWVLKCYWNDGVPYIALHKNGFQIDEGEIFEIDALRDWEDCS